MNLSELVKMRRGAQTQDGDARGNASAFYLMLGEGLEPMLDKASRDFPGLSECRLTDVERNAVAVLRAFCARARAAVEHGADHV